MKKRSGTEYDRLPDNVGASRMSHHPFSPSRLGRRVLCPGSFKLEEEAARRGLVIEEHADEAREGSLLHALLPPTESIEILEEEPRSAVMKAREWIADRTKGAEAVLYEVPLELWWQGRLLTKGTADLIALFPHPKPHVVADIKMTRVEPDREMLFWQLMAYAVMWWQRSAVAGIECYAFAPRMGLEMKESMDALKLGEMVHEISRVVDMSLLSANARRRHPAACRHCHGRPLCPEFGEALAVVPKKEMLPEDIHKLEQLVDLCRVVEALGPAARQKLKDLIQAGAESELYEVRSKRHDTVKTIEEVFPLVSEVLSQEEFLACCQIQITKLKAALKSKGGGLAGCVREGTTTYLKKKGSAE